MIARNNKGNPSRMVLTAIVMALLPAAMGASPGAPRPGAAGDAMITYRKVFKGSTPEYVQIRLNARGQGTCDIHQLDEDSSPQMFEVSAGLAQKIFDLAERLHNFKGVNLDVHKKIAYLGQKTFRYEGGGESNEVTFNYTLDTDAERLLQIFEGLARQTGDLQDLERAMRYDRLGVNDVLMQIESDVSSGALPEPEQLLPALGRLAGDEKFLDLARQRARSLAARIQAPAEH
jgi:hypothetical protein